MFCSKCGAKALDGAEFCEKCGAKLTDGNTALTAGAGNLVQQPGNIGTGEGKNKKRKKWPVILGVTAFFAILVIMIAVFWEGKTDYKATVEAHEPFAVSQGLPYTYGEVFEKYIESAKWKTLESEGETYVKISGTLKGTDMKVVITIKVVSDPGSPDIALISPETVTLDGVKSSTQEEAVRFIYGMFSAYDEGYKNLSELQQSAEGKVTADLSEIYTNEEAGISFRYPDTWWVTDSGNSFIPCIIYSSDSRAMIQVTYALSDFYGVLTEDKATVEKNFNEDGGNLVDLIDTSIDGIPARIVVHMSKEDEWKGDSDLIIKDYWYAVGDDMYYVRCSYPISDDEDYEAIFNAIMDSYTITEASDSSDTRPGAEDDTSFGLSDDEAKPILVDWLQRHPLKHNLTVRFTQQAADAGDGTKYLLYEMYIDQEEYGFLGVNPDHGDIVMDSVLDGAGNWITIQTAMDDWYLVYYWGWTDDSGYYSEYYMDDVYGVCTGDGIAILNYYAESDSYVICNYDLQCLIEYDDGTAASEVDISDFAGTYSCDASIDEEGGYANYYSLEIGPWDGYYFSITESWRGMDIIHDEWANPYTLVANTLTFCTIGSDGASYEMHTLTYIPAEYSPLGRDVIYIDGDEDMPFVRE